MHSVVQLTRYPSSPSLFLCMFSVSSAVPCCSQINVNMYEITYPSSSPGPSFFSWVIKMYSTSQKFGHT
jgi:hypothetical protein